MENLKELTIVESETIYGGFIIEFVGLCLAGFAMGYQIGKDAKERERSGRIGRGSIYVQFIRNHGVRLRGQSL